MDFVLDLFAGIAELIVQIGDVVGSLLGDYAWMAAAAVGGVVLLAVLLSVAKKIRQRRRAAAELAAANNSIFGDDDVRAEAGEADRIADDDVAPAAPVDARDGAVNTVDDNPTSSDDIAPVSTTSDESAVVPSGGSRPATHSQDEIFDRIEEVGNELHNTMSDALKTFADRLTATIDVRLTRIEEQTKHAGDGGGGEGFAKLFALLEKQGVYLHDQFDSMPSSEEGVARIRADLLQQVGEQTAQQLRDSIADLSKDMDAKMETLTKKMGEQLASEFTGVTDRVKSDFSGTLEDTLTRFGELQTRVNTLLDSAEKFDEMGADITSLSRLLLARGEAIHNQELANILLTTLPEGVFELSAKLGSQSVSAIVKLPGDGESVAIDATFDGHKYMRTLLAADSSADKQATCRQQMSTALCDHINQVAAACIAPPQTGDLALLFINSEATFAEVQAHHKDAVTLAVSKRVWMVSPTTLLTVLNMARNMIKDYQARVRLSEMQKELDNIFTEARAFEARLVEISDHINNAMRSVQRAETAGAQLSSHVRSVVPHQSSAIENTKDGVKKILGFKS